MRWKFKTKLFVEKSTFLKYRIVGIENYGETKSIAVAIKKYLNNLNDCGKKRIFSFFVTKNWRKIKFKLEYFETMNIAIVLGHFFCVNLCWQILNTGRRFVCTFSICGCKLSAVKFGKLMKYNKLMTVNGWRITTNRLSDVSI